MECGVRNGLRNGEWTAECGMDCGMRNGMRDQDDRSDAVVSGSGRTVIGKYTE
jgi:hypothetical protein